MPATLDVRYEDARCRIWQLSWTCINNSGGSSFSFNDGDPRNTAAKLFLGPRDQTMAAQQGVCCVAYAPKHFAHAINDAIAWQHVRLELKPAYETYEPVLLVADRRMVMLFVLDEPCNRRCRRRRG